jgi:biotin carboxylase
MTATGRGDAESLLFFGGGHPEYRAWELDQFRSRYRLKLITARVPTWEPEYFSEIELAQPQDRVAVSDTAQRLAKDGTVLGVLCYHEPAIEVAAQIAEDLGLPSLPADAARLCRDKHEARRAFAKHGVPSAASVLVHSADEAAAAAAEIGYPVIVKPRALAASFGVSRATAEPQVRTAFAVADRQVLNEPWLDKPPGVLVEEYLDGPEISVDSLTTGGRVMPLIYARKLVGFPPYCEELGHIVSAPEDVCDGRAAEATEVTLRAHAAIGIQHGTTHTELKLTSRGVRIVELNGRAGGDCIGYLGYLASGINLPLGAAAAACGEDAASISGQTCGGGGAGAAGVRFCYPDQAGVLRSLDIPAEVRRAGYVDRIEATQNPRTRITFEEGRLYNARVAYVIVTGATTTDCADHLAQAAAAISCDVDADA